MDKYSNENINNKETKENSPELEKKLEFINGATKQKLNHFIINANLNKDVIKVEDIIKAISGNEKIDKKGMDRILEIQKSQPINSKEKL
ncbi:MAG TPA: hypothetical protein EYG89_05850 [Bacteroidia bacterium]|nr:hypothetical protein [Bacteroidia bacterium]